MRIVSKPTVATHSAIHRLLIWNMKKSVTYRNTSCLIFTLLFNLSAFLVSVMAFIRWWQIKTCASLNWNKTKQNTSTVTGDAINRKIVSQLICSSNRCSLLPLFLGRRPTIKTHVGLWLHESVATADKAIQEENVIARRLNSCHASLLRWRTFKS